jgi:hypothetical protein
MKKILTLAAAVALLSGPAMAAVLVVADVDLGPAGGATEPLQWTNVESIWMQLTCMGRYSL